MRTDYSPELMPTVTRQTYFPERQDFAPERAHYETRFYRKREGNQEYRPHRDIPIPYDDEQPLPEPSTEHSTCLFRDPLDKLVKVCESQGEQNSLLMFCIDPNVVLIETQFDPVHYQDADGTWRTTVYDGRVSYFDGFRTLVSNKPLVRAEKTGHFEQNDLIIQQVSPDIADQAQVLTERDLPAWALANARLVQSVRNDGFWHFHEAMREKARDLVAPVTIMDFCEPFGGTAKCYRTAIKLIFDRELTVVEAGEIDIGTRVGPPREVVAS